jgi:hypothetical protein
LTLKFIYMLNEEAIAWISKKQQCIATFTVKSEYIALCKMIKKKYNYKDFFLISTSVSFSAY